MRYEVQTRSKVNRKKVEIGEQGEAERGRERCSKRVFIDFYLAMMLTAVK